MAARVRNVLYWLGTIVAVLAIGGVIFLFGVIFLCGLIVYGICRAALRLAGVKPNSGVR